MLVPDVVDLYCKVVMAFLKLGVITYLDVFLLVVFYGFFRGKSPSKTTIWENIAYFLQAV